MLRSARSLAGAFLALCMLCACGGSGTSTPAPPLPAAGMPSTALSAAQVQGIDSLMSAQIAQGLVPGAVLGIYAHGAPLYVQAYGARTVGPPTLPTQPITTFQIGSITKQFTAACVLLLAQDGKLALDDSLAKTIPEYRYANSITLRQLLNMTSGITGNVDTVFSTVYGTTTQAQVIATLSTVPLDNPPGTTFEYSNLNYYLLGVVIERVSGLAYSDFLAQRILQPQNLQATYYRGVGHDDPNTALGYYHPTTLSAPVAAHPLWSPSYLFSMGNLVSNVHDIEQWDVALRGGAVLSQASLATMMTPPTLPANAPTIYGMGWFVEPYGETQHNGETGGFHSMNAMFRSTSVDIIILGNDWDQLAGAFSPEDLASQVYDIVVPGSAVPYPF